MISTWEQMSDLVNLHSRCVSLIKSQQKNESDLMT